MTRLLPALTLAELTTELGSRARAVETLKWLYRLPALPERLPGELPGVSSRAWRPFVERSGLVSPVIRERQRTADGTTKYALSFGDAAVEVVRISGKGRSTICVSSQAGCTRRCVFCATKELGFTRNLTAGEMVAQYLVARAEAPKDQPARNVVFMGMGEPLDNLDEVLRAIEVLTQSPAPQLRAESVTVSTSGVGPGLRRFFAETKASLALSLNATTDEVRSQLMPHNERWPLGELLAVLRDEAVRSPRRVTFVEYVLFSGLNDTDADADRLVELLRGLPARVNVIPWNPLPPAPGRVDEAAPAHLVASPVERVRAFHDRVARQGQLCLVRWPRGREIAAACGQLVLAGSGGVQERT